MDNGLATFEASASALGYLHQLRFALVRAMEQLMVDLDWSIAIEAADDVELVQGGQRQLSQLKLRKPGTVLTDSSTDLWKTIRIWSTGVADGSIDPSTTQFFLLTTASLSTNSAAWHLVPNLDNRDIDKAAAILDKVAAKSRSKDNSKAYSAYSNLTDEQKNSLLEAVIVLHNEDNTDKLLDRLRQLLRIGTKKEYLDSLTTRLEGWWFRQSIDCLLGRQKSISADSIDEYVTDLRDQFTSSNLPIDEDVIHLPADIEKYQEKIFYQQLQIAEIGIDRVRLAVREYLRAFTQRSRWVREGLISPGELDEYERRLIEEWQYVRADLCESLDERAAEEEKIRIARDIYRWVQGLNPEPIRPHCTERFVMRGSYQMLADGRKVGWHPDFVARLIALLEPVTPGQ
jgi:hypothetical protein